MKIRVSYFLGALSYLLKREDDPILLYAYLIIYLLYAFPSFLSNYEFYRVK